MGLQFVQYTWKKKEAKKGKNDAIMKMYFSVEVAWQNIAIGFLLHYVLTS